MTEFIKTIIEEKPANDPFKYMMLSRMLQDCRYYLGCGNRDSKHLWSQDESTHITDMKALWNSLDDKPEWLSWDELLELEKQIVA